MFFVSLFFFIMAITLMKEGAKGLAPLVRDTFKVNTPANALGFGWLFAYLVMSGSPVAASALTFLDAEVLEKAPPKKPVPIGIRCMKLVHLR